MKPKITLINKSDSQGGAAVAALRLFKALQKNKVSVSMLVQEKNKVEENVFSTGNSKFKRLRNFINFVIERIHFLFYEKSEKTRYSYSTAISGQDISEYSQLKNADIIHLHWFNQGFLSLRSLKQIIELNKPVVWTLHDMWAFTGGCHYSGDCKCFETECNNCQFLKKPKNKDLSTRIQLKKEALYKNSNITFVTCSEWLAKEAKKITLSARI